MCNQKRLKRMSHSQIEDEDEDHYQHGNLVSLKLQDFM